MYKCDFLAHLINIEFVLRPRRRGSPRPTFGRQEPVKPSNYPALDKFATTMAAVESDSATIVPICIADLETYAKSKLDEGTWNYYYNGAADEITRRENVEAFNR
jgi:hypothetical protein